ncbi:MAG: 4'-phosphopantetheinyl transferase superfamily protein [Saprospiraceae bacterium]|nr:4'-phosphopantetheinyl transferase superfamily protein [Saprospiraceae bacterium]
MPLILKEKIREEGVFGIWEIDETDAFFEALLDLSQEESREVQQLKSRRRTEWLASRWLLHIISGRAARGILVKDEFGKPYIAGSNWYISISHTHQYTAAIAAPFLVGIDIQVRVEKITRIAKKFLSAHEAENVTGQRPIDYMHIYWGAKECLYKAYGRRVLDFKKDLRIDAFNIELERTSGAILKGKNQRFDLHFKVHKPYILVLALENNSNEAHIQS